MKQLTVLLSAAAILSVFGPLARAGNIDLYDFAVSTSTGISGDWQDLSTNDPTLIIDPTSTIYNDTQCCGDGTSGTTTGLGTVNYTFSPGAGSYTVSMYFDYDVSIPAFNEFGTINNAGSAQTGVAGEIFNSSLATGNIVLFGACGTPGCETYGAANGMNNVPGTTDNFLNDCSATDGSCNADVAMVLTYSFTLGADQYAVLTALASTTDPGGFSLQTTHPVDANNTAASSVYLTGSYAIDTVSTSTPEPSSWILMGTALALCGLRGVRRKDRV